MKSARQNSNQNMKTQSEIKAEIAELKALKPIGSYACKTQGTINAIVEELEDGWDMTAEEFESQTEGVKELIIMANEWKRGGKGPAPSEDWGGLVT